MEFARLGGHAGGKRRATKLSPKRRTEFDPHSRRGPVGQDGIKCGLACLTI